MKKVLVLISFAMIGSQSMVAMNPQSRWERETYGTREEQQERAERTQQMNIGYGHQAAQRQQNLYQIIGVDPSATISQIGSAYRKKHLELKRSGDQEEMKRLNHAKDVLTDPKARAAYDRARLESVD